MIAWLWVGSNKTVAFSPPADELAAMDAGVENPSPVLPRRGYKGDGFRVSKEVAADIRAVLAYYGEEPEDWAGYVRDYPELAAEQFRALHEEIKLRPEYGATERIRKMIAQEAESK